MMCCKRFMLFLTPFLVLALFALAGCGGGKPKKIKTDDDDTPTEKTGGGSEGGGEGGASSGDYAISGYGGSLKGRVTFTGSPDEGKPATKTPDKNQAECPKAIPEDGWYTQDSSDKKGVRFAVVFIRPAGATTFKEKDIDKGVLSLRGGTKEKPGAEFVEVEQPHCQFEPRVSLVFPNQMLRGKNNSSPPISHDFNLKDFRGNPAFSSTVSPNSQQLVNVDPSDRPYIVGCNQHTSFMNGYVWKVRHPFAAITDKNGDFVINTVPTLSKGKLELVVWHEMLKTDKNLKVIGDIAGTKDEQKSITLP